LHANLIPLGYPRFCFEKCTREEWQLAGGITNLADHIVMLPIYVSLGYSKERFLGPPRSLNEREQRVDADLKRMGERLRTPPGYLDCVARYLAQNEIRFTPIYLADHILAQRFCGSTR